MEVVCKNEKLFHNRLKVLEHTTVVLTKVNFINLGFENKDKWA